MERTNEQKLSIRRRALKQFMRVFSHLCAPSICVCVCCCVGVSEQHN